MDAARWDNSALSQPGLSSGFNLWKFFARAGAADSPATFKKSEPISGNALMPPLRAAQQSLQLPLNLPDLLRAQLRIHWQRQEFLRAAFGDWKRSALMAQEVVCLLEMKGDRIMNSTGDAPAGHLPQNLVPVLGADGIDMINVAPVTRLEWRDQVFDAGKLLIVELRVGASRVICLRQMSQLHAKHGTLNSIHPRIPADKTVMIFFCLPVIAQHLNLVLQFLAAGH